MSKKTTSTFSGFPDALPVPSVLADVSEVVSKRTSVIPLHAASLPEVFFAHSLATCELGKQLGLLGGDSQSQCRGQHI